MIIRGFYRFIPFSLIFLICLPIVNSQEYSDTRVVDSLIKIAMINNPEILSSRYSQESAEFKSKSAGTIPDPKFMISAMNLPRTSLSLDETPMSGIALGVSQMIPWPGKLNAKKAIAQLLSESRKQNILQKENSIIRMIKHFYYNYSFWAKAEEIIDNNIDLIHLLVDNADVKYANGVGSAQDALRARTTIARLENKKLLMSQMSRTALLNLGRLVDDNSIINSNLTVEMPENLVNVFSNGELNNPHLAKAKIHTSIENRKLTLAKSTYYPNFIFGLDYRIRKDMPMDAIHGEDFVTFKVGFQLPLWFFAKQKNETQSAHLAFKASEENYRSILIQLEQNISTVQLALTTLKNSFAQYENNIIPQAQATYESSRTAYEVGEIDFNTLLMSQLDLFEIELERIELLKKYWQKHAELSELNGEK